MIRCELVRDRNRHEDGEDLEALGCCPLSHVPSTQVNGAGYLLGFQDLQRRRIGKLSAEREHVADMLI